jgi:acid phosphatase family membrane protein YuiD
VAITLAFIVILDAGSLRRQIGRQAESINRLANQRNQSFGLRERIGHTKSEIFGGVALGLFVGCFVGWWSCIFWPAYFNTNC